MNRCATGLALAAILAIGAGPARAGRCSVDIAAFQRILKQKGFGQNASAPQTVGAQLEHQPTPASVAQAKKEANADVDAAVREAKMLNAQNKRAECEATLAKARLLLHP
jgi:hypothetical protein